MRITPASSNKKERPGRGCGFAAAFGTPAATVGVPVLFVIGGLADGEGADGEMSAHRKRLS